MIPVMNSVELNKIFAKAQENNIDFEKQLQAIKNDMSKKMTIIKYENAFISQKIDVINAGLIKNDKIVKFNNNVNGIFNNYGYMIHPKFKKSPIDIFNLKLPNGDNFFKETVIAKVNDIEKPNYINLLMADNHISKSITFDEYDTNKVKLEYSLSNEYTLGVMRFNTIEIDPYMYGAYDLDSIEVYTIDETGIITSEPTFIFDGYSNIGRTRIVLPEKIKFSKVIFNFTLNYKTEVNFVDIYPFGLKHIHFYEADYSDTSFAIAEFTTDKFVEYVMEDITLYTINGKKKINAKDYGIEVYTDYENNTLIGKVNLSNEASIYRIPKNTKTIYVKIPLIKTNPTNKTKEYLCLNGLELNFTTNQEIIL